MSTNTETAIKAGLASLTHLRLIEVLAEHGPLSMRDASQHCGITSAGMTGASDNLADHHGMVRRRSAPGDRRMVMLELTEKGEAFAATLHLEPATA